MGKSWLFVLLFLAYAGYSFVVYTKGTDSHVHINYKAREGKLLFQEYNCISCHQVYGLGGYLGPELTTAWSDPARGEQFIRAFLKAGGRTMPNFQLNSQEINAITEYLRLIDSTAVSYKKQQTGK
jgi:nitric oxide reductase subunit C